MTKTLIPNIVVSNRGRNVFPFSSSENNAIIKLLDVETVLTIYMGPDIFNINIEHDETASTIEGMEVFALGDDCFAIAWATLYYYGDVEEYYQYY
jgi:hypothetical protein